MTKANKLNGGGYGHLPLTDDEYKALAVDVDGAALAIAQKRSVCEYNREQHRAIERVLSGDF